MGKIIVAHITAGGLIMLLGAAWQTWGPGGVVIDLEHINED